MFRFLNGTVVLPDRLLPDGEVVTLDDRIAHVGAVVAGSTAGRSLLVDLAGGYLLPGFVDLHVHGGDGADFMDGTAEAFRTVCRPTPGTAPRAARRPRTVARHDQHLALPGAVPRASADEPAAGAASSGRTSTARTSPREARGCHPAAAVRSPTPAEFEPFLEFADDIRTATVAPELPGAEAFVRACRARGVRCNAGHSHATFAQVEAAVGWGVRHVDHLFCAMSDRARLRQTQTYPMRGGVMEATLYFDELTTEVIADGKHLRPDAAAAGVQGEGPGPAGAGDRLRCGRWTCPTANTCSARSTAASRSASCDGVGVTLDGKALASGVMGMDHCVRTILAATGVPLPEAVRMASLTPARIAGVERGGRQHRGRASGPTWW